MFHYSKANTKEAFCEHAWFFEVEGGENRFCIISDTCFSDFPRCQEAFLFSDLELSLAGLFFSMPWDPVSFPCLFCTPVLSAILKCLSHRLQDCTPTQENSEGQTFCSLQVFLPISLKIMFVWLIFLASYRLPTETPCPVNC